MSPGAAEERMRRRKRKEDLRRGGKARAESAQARNWKKMFPDLMNRILGLLQSRDVCRARAVCKYWNESVGSPGFLSQHACMDAPTVALFDFGNRPPILGFHTELERWVRLPALFSHKKDYYLVAATKGLYVYNATDDKEDTWRRVHDKRNRLVVTNQWTGATKWLPLMLKEGASERPVFTLDVVDNGSAYIITAINPHEEVYDSRLGYWTAFSAPFDPDMVNLSLARDNSSNLRCIRVMGSLYFVAHDRLRMSDVQKRLVHIISFNLENQKWSLVYKKWIKLGRRYEPWLTTCDNKLVVVDMWKTQTEVGGQILTLDVECGEVPSPETTIPKALASTMVVDSNTTYHRSGSLEVLTVGTGHLLHFFHYQGTCYILTTYDFHTKMWKKWAPSVVVPMVQGATGEVVDVQLSFLPVKL